MSTNRTIVTFKDEDSMVLKLGSYLEELSREAIAQRKAFFIGVSGGSLLSLLCRALPNIESDWSGWVIALCDERLVGRRDAQSTAGHYERALLPLLQPPPRAFLIVPPKYCNYESRTQKQADDAARAYSECVKREWGEGEVRFDCLILGMGPDGHTCSLFPGRSDGEGDGAPLYVGVVNSPKPPPDRITLSYRAINAARHALIVVTGAGKADTVRKALAPDSQLPISRVQPTDGKVTWLLDTAAASLLDPTVKC